MSKNSDEVRDEQISADEDWFGLQDHSETLEDDMFKRKSTIILALILIALLSFVFSSQALADLTTLYPTSGQAAESELILQPTAIDTMTDKTLELQLLDAEQVVARRLDQLDLPEPYQVIQQNGQLIVILPEGANTPYVNSMIVHVGAIQFIDAGTQPPVIGRRINIEDGAEYQVLFTGQDVQRILSPDVATGQIFYEIVLQPDTAEGFSQFAQNDQGHHLCIVMDEEVISCSAMYHWDEGTLEIIPNLSSGAVVTLADLAIFLESGPLPMPLIIE